MTDTALPIIAIVVPCYNEEAALPLSAPELLKILDCLTADGLADKSSYILFVNDGSSDKTWEIICRLHASDSRIKGINLTHNRGHQYALLAGLMTVRDRCDAAISIDADLQDDPAAIIEMVQHFLEGNEIVYGVRSSRASDTMFKRTTAHAFYKLQKIMGLETVYDHADFRLMSQRALNLLADYKESNLFLRGIVPQIGLKNSKVFYERNPRVAGESKYPLKKMLLFSIDGITSFSAKPMRWIFTIGFISFIATGLVAIYVICSLFMSKTISHGWASVMLSIWGIGSVIMMALGVIGEYVGKIFVEVKSRPRFAIQDKLWD